MLLRIKEFQLMAWVRNGLNTHIYTPETWLITMFVYITGVQEGRGNGWTWQQQAWLANLHQRFHQSDIITALTRRRQPRQENKKQPLYYWSTDNGRLGVA